jgi:pimeloyl-ACP methyl ester carboxylesterase
MQPENTPVRSPLVHLDANGKRTPGHELLAGDQRMITFEAADVPRAVLAAVTALGVEMFDLLGTSSGAESALRVAILAPERVSALVLESPVAIRPDDRDPELEAAMRELTVPALVVFGTRDEVIPPETGRLYKELLPTCQLLFVYDAGHAVSADRPEAFAEAVADFLARHDQYVVSRRSSVLFP